MVNYIFFLLGLILRQFLMPRHSELDRVIFLPLYRRIHVDSRILPGHAIGSKNNFYNKNKGL